MSSEDVTVNTGFVLIFVHCHGNITPQENQVHLNMCTYKPTNSLQLAEANVLQQMSRYNDHNIHLRRSTIW